MPINQSDIEKVAQLAHLELDEEELKTFGPQITEIVNYVEQLNELDTANVEPAIGGLTPEGAKTDSSATTRSPAHSAKKPPSRKHRIQRTDTSECRKFCSTKGTKSTQICRVKLLNFR